MQVSDIPQELTRVWDTLERTGKMRASLFNLLVITPKNIHADYFRQITHKVLDRFPSRVIFITIDQEAPSDTLEASVSIIPPGSAKGNADIVCEFIEITVSKQNTPKIPFLILPHLLPDLPLYLLWGEDPLIDNPLSHQLEKWATRIIFDSEVTDNLAAFARTLLDHSHDCEIADLNWARTENWRELLSSTFYSPERLEALKKAQKIKMVYNAKETPRYCHTQIQALYLQAWLASQLNIKSDIFELSSEKNPDLAPGTVISMDILCPESVHFNFCRDQAFPHQVKTIFCDQVKCEIPSKFIFTKTQSGLSLVNEITHNGTSAHFLKVLQYLGT